MTNLGVKTAAGQDVIDVYDFLIAQRDSFAPPAVAQAKIVSPATSVVVGSTLTISGSTSTPNGVTYQWAVRDPASVTTTAGTAATQIVTFATVGSYRITLTVQPSGGGTQSSDSIDIAVTAAVGPPAAGFSPAGFVALTNFSASPSGSDTMCPTIQNTGTASLTLIFSAVRAAGSGADYSNYFELGDNASCPATPRACNTSMPAGSPISGGTTLQFGASPPDSACTLALRFNPAKFRDAASDIAARSAMLQVMHNAPAGTVAEFPITGNLTIAPLPPVVGGTPAFLTASAASLSLGSVRVGAQSAPVELRLASAGNGVVQVTGMESGAPFTVHSKTCPSPPFTLLSGSDCTVTVTFTPTDARAATATLRISTDANTKALEVPLAGNGEEKADVSSGGCSMASGDTLADPTLWALLLLAIAAIIYRHRARAAPRRHP